MEHQDHKHSHSAHEHKHHHGGDNGNHENSGHDGHGHDHHKHMIKDFKKRFWVSLIIMIPIVILAPMIQELLGYEFRFKGNRYLQFVLSSIIFFYGGWSFLKGLVDEVKDKSPGMMTLIAMAISVAYFYSSAVVFGLSGRIFFWELASLIVIMLLGHWIEMKSVMGASNALEELAQMMPSTARRVKENEEYEDVPIDNLQKDDIILVRPGEKVPADGIVLEGESHVNESMLTGESKPVGKKQKDEVVGGSINDNGTLKIKVGNTGENSYLSKVIKLVKEAQETKSKTQNLADRAAAWLFYVALGSGIISLIVWLSVGKEFEYALERMVTVMIISCPHALGLAVPLVVAISTAVSAKNGLLIRNRTAFENSRQITSIIFDKTGTLTKGEFGVSRYKSVQEGLSDNDLLQIAASVENSSEHPIAAGIVRKAEAEELQLERAESFKNITGKGIQANIKGKEIQIVSPGMLKDKGIDQPSEAFGSEDETVVFVLIDDKIAGYVALADEIRSESLSAVNTLKERGIKVTMATGDNEKVAKAVSEQLGLDDYYAEVLPEDKQSIIKKLQEKGEFVAMTGDGVNDAPALAQANVGIAVGSGTDVAAETADIILVNSNPKDIASLILFGAATYKKMMQNLWWAAGYTIIAVTLATGVLAGVGIILSPAVGAILMSLS
ncbi:MAG: cadmium-translocating P-type ATPase, partial [Arenibacter algicola]|nr:cadmium-translocating P-type ATPase [Arenibacter algicola]